jgi:lipopolysaccharide transport system ATP-binding protein
MSFEMMSKGCRNPIAIEARGLTKTYHVYANPQDRLKQVLWPGRRRFYQEFVAVRDVDLAIHRGETVGIVGRNGSGKSTLLKLICGLLEYTAGELSVHGHIAPMLTLGAGFDPYFTGRENAILNASILGLTDTEVHDRLDDIASFAELGDFFDAPVKSYSSGMYSRLAFAVAINADPEILVIDEVLAVGDEAFTRKCFARIEEIKKNGATILFVSHSPNLVIELCDRAVLMEAGERVLTADPKTIISRYQKLLYSSDTRRAVTLEEIRDLDARRSSSIGGISRTSNASPVENSKSVGSPEASRACAKLDPTLESKSTMEYERRGAYIENARVLDSIGRPVNVLYIGGTFTFAYEVTFLEPAFCVRFGMLLKSVTGFELAGQASHRAEDAIARVECGSKAKVRFRFRTLLVPGSYFLNAGVLGFLDGGETYLHRILDVVMLRIEPDEQSLITGQVDLSASSPADVEIMDSAGDPPARSGLESPCDSDPWSKYDLRVVTGRRRSI